MKPVIEIKQVYKDIGKNNIIKNVSLSMYPGEIFGLLGPNGAGKTTTIRMIVGLMKPTKGDIYISEKNLATHFEEAIRNIGAVVENPEMYSYMSGYDNLKHFQRMVQGVTNDRLQEVIKLVGLQDRIHEKVGTYSLGMRQRLGLAQALLHKPKVLILDEPTNGLDPAGIREIRDYLRNLAVKDKICIIVSSHLLAEIEKMCDRIAIIKKGEIISVETVKDFVQYKTNEWFMEVSPIEKAEEVLKASFDTAVTLFENGFIIHAEKETLPEIIRELVNEKISVYEVKSAKQNTLEDQFLTITGGEMNETV